MAQHWFLHTHHPCAEILRRVVSPCCTMQAAHSGAPRAVRALTRAGGCTTLPENQGKFKATENMAEYLALIYLAAIATPQIKRLGGLHAASEFLCQLCQS
eukprot:354419-Chlamydomonas_euryale.AAC.3